MASIFEAGSEDPDSEHPLLRFGEESGRFAIPYPYDDKAVVRVGHPVWWRYGQEADSCG